MNLGKDATLLGLHFNPRFDAHGDVNTIVCNSKKVEEWGAEHREAVFPFQKGGTAEVRHAYIFIYSLYMLCRREGVWHRTASCRGCPRTVCAGGVWLLLLGLCHHSALSTDGGWGSNVQAPSVSKTLLLNSAGNGHLLGD